MTLCCKVNQSGVNFQWQDLKTVKGYLNRLKQMKGITEFEIMNWNGFKCGRYHAIKAPTDRYWDYRINEFRDVSELVNHDLTRVITNIGD